MPTLKIQKADGTFEFLQLAGEEFADIGNQVLGVKAQLTKTDQDIKGRSVNVMFPPPPFVAPKGDGITDDSIALQNIINSFRNIYFPNNNFLVLSPLLLKDGIHIEGGQIPRDIVGESRTTILVNGNNAFETGSLTNRIRFTLKNLMIKGTTKTETGVNGSFGGRIEGVFFNNLGIGVNNPIGYIVKYVDCSFRYNDIGLVSDVSNAVLVDQCLFSNNRIHADMGRDSAPVTFKHCTINLSSNTEKCFILNGGVAIDNCYFEAFGALTVDSLFIDYSFSKFGNAHLTITDCEINATNKIKHAIRLSMEPGQTVGRLVGEIKHNRIINCTNEHIVYGSNNDFQGINIHSNNPTVAVLNRNPLRAYKPMTSSLLMDSIDCTGTFTRIPLNKSVVYDNVDAFSTVEGNYRVRRSGVYKINVSLTIRTTVDLRNIDVQLRKNSTGVARLQTSVKHISGDTYKTISMEVIVPAEQADTFSLHAQTAGFSHGGTFTCEWLSE